MKIVLLYPKIKITVDYSLECKRLCKTSLKLLALKHNKQTNENEKAIITKHKKCRTLLVWGGSTLSTIKSKMDVVDSRRALVFKKEKERGLMKEKAIVDIYCHEKIDCSVSSRCIFYISIPHFLYHVFSCSRIFQ